MRDDAHGKSDGRSIRALFRDLVAMSIQCTGQKYLNTLLAVQAEGSGCYYQQQATGLCIIFRSQRSTVDGQI